MLKYHMNTEPRWLAHAKKRVAETRPIAVGSDVHLLEMAVAAYEKVTGKPCTLTEKELHAAAHRMETSGGGFAGLIASAWFKADSDNKARILNSFGHMFERYVPEPIVNEE